MNWNDIKKTAREQLKGYCRVCPICDGRACAGEVPGMGGSGTGAAFRANLEDLAGYKLNMRTLHSATDPSTAAQIFGRDFSLPVLAAPMTGVSYNMGGKMTEREFIGAIIKGSAGAGSTGMCGDGGDPAFFSAGLEAIAEEGGNGIAIIKPRANDAIKERMSRAQVVGALAVGLDVDGAGLVTMALHGQPVGPKTWQDIKELTQSTDLPFIIKGIMTVDEALLAAEAGASCVVVSNHGGRILDHTPGAARVLPQIAAALKGRVTIMADGGVRSGVDVFKLLALGADAVLVGRPLVVAAFGGGGDQGVKFLLEKLGAELRLAMILTGCSKIADINYSRLV